MAAEGTPAYEYGKRVVQNYIDGKGLLALPRAPRGWSWQWIESAALSGAVWMFLCYMSNAEIGVSPVVQQIIDAAEARPAQYQPGMNVAVVERLQSGWSPSYVDSADYAALLAWAMS